MSSELKELFQHIGRYTPQSVELETRLRPFIPEYIPAIGDIDAFLKVGQCCGQGTFATGQQLCDTKLLSKNHKHFMCASLVFRM